MSGHTPTPKCPRCEIEGRELFERICGHSVCAMCLVELSPGEPEIECPMCESDRIAALEADNAALRGLLARLHKAGACSTGGDARMMLALCPKGCEIAAALKEPG